MLQRFELPCQLTNWIMNWGMKQNNCKLFHTDDKSSSKLAALLPGGSLVKISNALLPTSAEARYIAVAVVVGRKNKTTKASRKNKLQNQHSHRICNTTNDQCFRLSESGTPIYKSLPCLHLLTQVSFFFWIETYCGTQLRVILHIKQFNETVVAASEQKQKKVKPKRTC